MGCIILTQTSAVPSHVPLTVCVYGFAARVSLSLWPTDSIRWVQALFRQSWHWHRILWRFVVFFCVCFQFPCQFLSRPWFGVFLFLHSHQHSCAVLCPPTLSPTPLPQSALSNPHPLFALHQTSGFTMSLSTCALFHN